VPALVRRRGAHRPRSSAPGSLLRGVGTGAISAVCAADEGPRQAGTGRRPVLFERAGIDGDLPTPGCRPSSMLTLDGEFIVWIRRPEPASYSNAEGRPGGGVGPITRALALHPKGHSNARALSIATTGRDAMRSTSGIDPGCTRLGSNRTRSMRSMTDGPCYRRAAEDFRAQSGRGRSSDFAGRP